MTEASNSAFYILAWMQLCELIVIYEVFMQL